MRDSHREPEAPRDEFAEPAYLDSARRPLGRTHLSLRIADRPELRHAALDLVLEHYKRCGYVAPDATYTHVHRFATVPGSTTFVICDDENAVLATATVVPDGPWGLPMDSIYREELNALREEGRVLCEGIGFASRVLESKATLKHILTLTRAVMWYSFRVGRTDLVVAVNPRHVGFYARLLPFQIIGPERQYQTVRGAPAVPLRLDLLALPDERERRRHVYSRYLGQLDLKNIVTTSTYVPVPEPTPGGEESSLSANR